MTRKSGYITKCEFKPKTAKNKVTKNGNGCKTKTAAATVWQQEAMQKAKNGYITRT